MTSQAYLRAMVQNLAEAKRFIPELQDERLKQAMELLEDLAGDLDSKVFFGDN